MALFHSKRCRLKSFLLFLCLAARSAFAGATDFYVDPENGSASGDGSKEHPWISLQQVLDDGLVESLEPLELPYDGTGTLADKNPGAPVRAGDSIVLSSGDYGALTIQGFYNEDFITIRNADGADARFSSVLIRGSAMWRIEGLHVSSQFADPYESHTLIDLQNHNWQGPVSSIAVEGCTLSSVDDASSWTDVDWDTLSSNGIQVDGSDHVIRNNLLKNVNFGISVSATHTLVEGNVVDGFAGDGMRGLGDYSVFQYNTVKNCYAVNANHDDGFQSWSLGEDGSVGTGEVKGIVLRGNTIINYEDPAQPYRGTLQGIGCFDGTFVDWVVENNIVITDHWHGITLLGARNCRIVNNTVLDENEEEPGPPWISIEAHKDGTPPSGCIVRNNLTTDLSDNETVTEDHNLIIEDPNALFVDAARFDVHLLETASAAIDRGSSELAPTLDADRIIRPQGDGIDLGAYELHDSDVEPVDAGSELPSEDTDASADSELPDNAEADGAAAGCGCRAAASSDIADSVQLIRALIARPQPVGSGIDPVPDRTIGTEYRAQD